MVWSRRRVHHRSMVTLHIEHPISDYATWRTAFDRLAVTRHEAGVIDQRLARPIHDTCYIVVDLDFDSVELATSFLRFLETKVWTSPTSAPALVGRPRTTILESAPPMVTDAR